MAMLGLTLLGGFAWYERSRPPSQIVALVAALAAISRRGPGRLLADPERGPDHRHHADRRLRPRRRPRASRSGRSRGWSPTSGSARGRGPPGRWRAGGSPGSSAPPWRVATRRRIGRVRLALICAFAGFAYGALLDFSLMVDLRRRAVADRFLALSARGLPFNIAHAAGNAALALVAGPAMIRMLLRYRHRFEFAWKRDGSAVGSRGIAAGAACVLGALLIASPVLAGGGRASASGGGSGAAVAWLRGRPERRRRVRLRQRARSPARR